MAFESVESCYRCFFFTSRRRHTRCSRDWSSDVCSSDLGPPRLVVNQADQVQLVRHRCELPANGLQSEKESAVVHDRHFAVETDRRTMNLQRTARSEERRVGKEWEERGGTESPKYKD